MVLQAKLINSEAALNNFMFIQEAEFVPGGELTVAMALWNSELKIRYVPAATAVVKFTFPTTNASIEKTATLITADDRSLVKVAFTAEETEDLTGGNFTFEVDVLGNGTQIIKGYVNQGLSRITAGGSCC